MPKPVSPRIDCSTLGETTCPAYVARRPTPEWDDSLELAPEGHIIDTVEAASNAVKSLLDRYFYSVKKGRYGRDWVEILGESTGKLLDQELEMAHARLLKEIKTHPPGRWEQSGVGNCWRRALAIFLASRHIARYQKIIGSLVPTPNNTSLVVVVADK